jgi:hypothetical protein
MGIKREGKGVNGHVVPPGNYDIVLSHDGKIIGKRSILVTDDVEVDMVTSKKPYFPVILSMAVVIFTALSIAISFRKISLGQIFMVLSMAAIVLSIICPWWHMTGEGDGMEISTNVFLIPAKMVTVGRADDFINGGIAAMPSSFETMLFAVTAVSAFSVTAILISFLPRKKWLLFIAIASIVASILIFSYGMSQVAEVTTGSFWGSGNVHVSLPGSDEKVIEGAWSPAAGYYMAVASLLLLIVSLFFKIKPIVIHRRMRDKTLLPNKKES